MTVPPDLEAVAVLADRLQTEGDPRGELLALELAAARAPEVEESRRLCEVAQSLRHTAPDVAWPKALWGWHGLIRAGLLVVGGWRPQKFPRLPAEVGPQCRSLIATLDGPRLGLAALADAQARTDLNLDGLWDREGPARPQSDRPVMLDLAGPLRLPALAVSRPIIDCESLARIDGLEHLEVAVPQLQTRVLEQLPNLDLGSLGLFVRDAAQLGALLDACPRLERLRVHGQHPPLARLPGLERLRELSLFNLPAPQFAPAVGRKLSDDLAVPKLESLVVAHPELGDLERIAGFELRRLTVIDPIGDPVEIVAKLAELDTLEQLVFVYRPNHAVYPAPLGKLSRLRSLELRGNFNGELELPTVERLVLGWGASHLRVRGRFTEIHSMSSTIHILFSHVSMDSVVTLGLSSIWAHVATFERVADRLAGIETLHLEGGQPHDQASAWIGTLPRLRALIWPNLSIRQQRTAAERLPYVQIIGADAPTLRRDWPQTPGFDPLEPCNWPKAIGPSPLASPAGDGRAWAW